LRYRRAPQRLIQGKESKLIAAQCRSINGGLSRDRRAVAVGATALWPALGAVQRAGRGRL
jgi:hypothetical protein